MARSPALGVALAIQALAVVGAARAAAASGTQGVVRDAGGAPIVGAEIVVSGANGPLALAFTGPDGSFAFDPAGEREGRLVVHAAGFASVERPWSAEASEALVIVLARSRLSEEVIVTATRGESRLGDTAARAVVIGAADLRATAAPTLDDALRQVPGFSLFRRSDSRVANPTAQGASLRGVGASGASRTLVLLDGVPLNDAFGGWVYWSRVPRVAVERLEVVEGGASDLYGSAALGGIVQALGRTDAPALVLEASGGTLETAGLSLYAAERRGAWSVRGAGEAFTSDGYVLVPADERGPVDTAAGGRHLAGTLTVERRTRTATAFLRAGAFGESRANGTPLQVNDTDWQELGAGGDIATGRAGTFSIRAWFATQTYHQTFSAVAADRASESLTRRQRVPSEAGGLGLEWSRALGSRHVLLVGGDGRLVEGRSDETPFSQAGQPLASVSAGGREATWAFFATDRAALGSRTLLTLGMRLDRWDGGPDGTTALSPRASILVRAARQLRVTAAAYGAFRAPTLNERYRSFRVGNTLTLANAELEPERLRGGEVGLAWSRADEGLRLRGVGFVSRIDDPIANVTVRSTPLLITRERRNLGRNRSQGLEVDAEARLGRRLRASLGYALIDATIDSFPASPELEGNLVPQVARHQLTFGVRFVDPGLLELSAQGRAASEQFEDDRNQLVLPGYFTLDLQASRRVGRVAAFAALENLTGVRYAVGLTPIPTEGPPRCFRFGLRFE